jgi:hypothetical protein
MPIGQAVILVIHHHKRRIDRIEAYKWFFIESKNEVRCGDDAMRIAEQRMTSREVAEARVCAREWYRKNSS